MNPQARSEDIVVQEVFDELVIYDLKRDKVHSLNPTAAFVWQHCDGTRAPADLALLLQMKFGAPQAETLLWYTLDRLDQAHLLAERLTDTAGRHILTRREMLKLAGLTLALLPVVKSIVAPTAAQAVTGTRVKVLQQSTFTSGNCGNNCPTPCPTPASQNCSGTVTKKCIERVTGGNAQPGKCICCYTQCGGANDVCPS